MLQLILLVFAFVLFTVGAYLTPDLGTRLTRIGLALVALAYLLSGVPLHR